MWDPFIMYKRVTTSQLLRSGSPVKRVWLLTPYIHKFECCYRWGDGPSILLGMQMVMEVQLPIELRVALNAFTTRSMEGLFITR